MDVHTQYVRADKKWTGLFICQVEKEKIDLNMKNCGCRSAERSGIPCCHLIALRRLLGYPYLDLFAERWLLKDENSTSNK